MCVEEPDVKKVNDSTIHVDFMIGSPEVRVLGLAADGTETPVLVNGAWQARAGAINPEVLRQLFDQDATKTVEEQILEKYSGAPESETYAEYRSNAQRAFEKLEKTIIREHIGPTGYDNDFAGYDVLILANLSGNPLLNPMLGDDSSGLDPAFLQSLLTGGTTAQWLGTGSSSLTSLDGYDLYETLIPTGTDLINASVDGASLSGLNLADGGAASRRRPIDLASPGPRPV